MFFRNPVVDLVLALVVVLLIFGPKRLPSLGKSLGHGIREFKDGITGKSSPEEDRPALNSAEATPLATDSGARVEETVPAAPTGPPAAPQARESAEVGSTEQRA